MLLAALLWILGLALRRTSDSSRGDGVPSRGAAPAASEIRSEPADSSPSGAAPARVSVREDSPAESASPESVPAAPATISGRLRLDGVPSEGGRLRLRRADGSWEGSAAIDYEGRFRIGGVPAARLEVSFELPPGEARQLLLPMVEVAAAPGGTEELELDWQTRHVNVRVRGDGAAGNRARIDVEGPRTRASIETDESGKARLSLVGPGLFSFRAVQPGGREGVATLELEAGAGLDSVVINTTSR